MNLETIKCKIIEDIDSDDLEKNVSNVKSLKHLAKYFNIITEVKKGFIEPIEIAKKVNFIINPDFEELKKVGCSVSFADEKESIDITYVINYYKLIEEAESLDDLERYANLDDEALFSDLLNSIKKDKLNLIRNGDLRDFVYKAKSYNVLTRILNVFNWFELLSPPKRRSCRIMKKKKN